MTQTQNTPVTLLKRDAVTARTALPKSSLYALIAKGDFPAPVKLTAKAVAWSSAAVDSWIAARIAAGASA
jgi:prophage regulatory protein